MSVSNFSGTAVLLGILMLGAGVLLTIVAMRYLISRHLRSGALDRNHFRRVIFTYQRSLHGLALCVALAASYLTINWTTPVTTLEGLAGYVVAEEELVVQEIPQTYFAPPPPPPPPPPTEILAVPDEPLLKLDPFDT